MTKDIINTVILGGLFLALFGLGEIMYHFLKIKVELTRKFVHFGTGLLTLLFPIMLGNHWLVLILCASFAVILISSLKFNLLKSINAIDRESNGSILYPLSVYICYLAFDYFEKEYIYFYLPVLILAICDPIAALTGKKWPIGKYKIRAESKSLMGSGMFFISALLLSIVLITSLNPAIILSTVFIASIFIALMSALAEGLSTKGYDNLSIPLMVLACMVVLTQIYAR